MNSVSQEILQAYQNKVPIIITSSPKSGIQLEKTKFIVPKNITLREFHCILLKYIQKNSKQSVMLFIDNTLPLNTESVSNLYSKHKSEDGFLYMTVSRENTFG